VEGSQYVVSIDEKVGGKGDRCSMMRYCGQIGCENVDYELFLTVSGGRDEAYYCNEGRTSTGGGERTMSK
jgi:hypothetical protein